ncbi:hypothetical protein AX16_000577 [Volvariella volvacea WC 439]|nr:hypothetical protein AX16_000577 [Volvariella volvacea WC 439]
MTIGHKEQSLPPELQGNSSMQRVLVEGKQGRGADGRDMLFSEADYVNMVSLAFSDFALWSNPELRHAIDTSAAATNGGDEHVDEGVTSNFGFISLNYLLSSLPVLAPLKLVDHGNDIVKALRAHAADVFDVRLHLEPPTARYSRRRQGGGRQDAALFEIRRKDWQDIKERVEWTKDAWDKLTVYVENIPTGYRTVSGILRLVQELLSRLPSSSDSRWTIQGIAFPPHHQDKGGEAPTCKGFALITLSSRKAVKALLKAWPWDALARNGTGYAPGVKDVSLCPYEAEKSGFRVLFKEQWSALREEYLDYRRRLTDEITNHQRTKQVQVQEVGVEEFSGSEINSYKGPPPQDTQNEDVQTTLEPNERTLSLNSPFPYGCLVFIRNVHTQTNKTTLRALFSKALRTKVSGDGLDYVDYNKGMDSCHLRLAVPGDAHKLVEHFSRHKIVQTSGLDDVGAEDPDSPPASVIRCEIMNGQRESLYWERVPEKIRRQAVQKALAVIGRQEGSHTKRPRTGGEGSEAGETTHGPDDPIMQRSHRRRRISSRRGTFDPSDSVNVKHTRLGVWDLYEEVHHRANFITSSISFEPCLQLLNNMSYVWRMLGDIGSIRGAWWLLVGYLATELTASLIPALYLWYSGQLLQIVQTAVEKRTIDYDLLMRIAIGRFICSLAKRLLGHASQRLQLPLNARIKRHYDVHMYHALARLDLPTFEDMAVQRQLEQALPASSRTSIAWNMMTKAMNLASTVIQLISQVSVLAGVLYGQQDGLLLALLTFAHSVFQWLAIKRPFIKPGVWAATTRNIDYIKMEGLKRVVGDGAHRKEIIAGNMAHYLVTEYRRRLKRLGDWARDFFATWADYHHQTSLTAYSILEEILKELPQIVFTLRAVQYPFTIPISLASLNLITQTTNSFSRALLSLVNETGSIAEEIASVRRLYEVTSIPNKILDGREHFPENQRSLSYGVSIEFVNVSFKYPDHDYYALHNVSFKLTAGQLCVIVGVNGSGKSTILKLLARLYDPTEGYILVDGRDIKTLRVADLRRTIAVLFQDYTLFPLSIKDNIGLGDPSHVDDIDRIREAARLGGAEGFIDKLSEGFDTYLERPVKDHYSGLPAGTTELFGRPVDYSRLRNVAGMDTSGSKTLSGGQLQRIALSRTFMRSIVSDSELGIGLLLFDEPSASLDPTAEHDLFERLRQLRGNKTMIFSSHRFGNLTRHADLILYLNDSTIVEEGTHEELIRHGGEYARIWNLQAQAFLS